MAATQSSPALPSGCVQLALVPAYPVPMHSRRRELSPWASARGFFFRG